MHKARSQTTSSDHSVPRTMKAAERVAVVTGANKGVGYFIAASLIKSRLFGTVVLACRDADKGSRAAAEMGGVYLPLTVGDAASVEAFAATLTAKYGRCDCLVNNAGVGSWEIESPLARIGGVIEVLDTIRFFKFECARCTFS